MCGRITCHSGIEKIAREFHVSSVPFDMEPSYNIAPSQNIVVIKKEGINVMVQCRWGFIPPSAKDEKVGYKMINARAETVATVPAFRSAFQNQRCLVVADGFYEWKKEEGRKIPFYIRRKSGKPFGFAGLFNIWTSPEGEDICTSTIITTDANELLFPIHDRMPAIIPEDRQDRWLDPTIHDRKVLIGLLEPYPPEELDMYEVSPRVNSPAYDSSDSIKPLKE